MRKQLGAWLHYLAALIEGRYSSAETAAAWDLVQVQDARDHVSGEYKRHVVYAQLIKMFPDRDKRDLALILEQAVQKLPRKA